LKPKLRDMVRIQLCGRFTVVTDRRPAESRVPGLPVQLRAEGIAAPAGVGAYGRAHAAVPGHRPVRRRRIIQGIRW